jgi:hypothetical protein
MKRILSLILVLGLIGVVIGLAVLIRNHFVPTIITSKVVEARPSSVAELEEWVDEIVLVTVTDINRQEEYTILEIPMYRTFTTVQVDHVFKGSLESGSKIEIGLPHGYVRKPTGLYLITTGRYLPLKRNSSYLLFVVVTPSGYYAISPDGKFVFPPPDVFTAKTLEIGEVDSLYLLLLNEVWEKYLPQIDHSHKP